MKRDEFDRDMDLFKYSSCPYDMYDLAYDFIEQLEQQIQKLQEENEHMKRMLEAFKKGSG